MTLLSLLSHTKDVEYLNKPIQHYKQMHIIFGNGQATGKYAMGSIEPLGTPSDFAESSLKTDPAGISGVARQRQLIQLSQKEVLDVRGRD